jgi:hypothetical protein
VPRTSVTTTSAALQSCPLQNTCRMWVVSALLPSDAPRMMQPLQVHSMVKGQPIAKVHVVLAASGADAALEHGAGQCRRAACYRIRAQGAVLSFLQDCHWTPLRSTLFCWHSKLSG